MQVKFQMNEEIWNIVVTNSEENMEVVSENSQWFIVEYHTFSDFIAAEVRFDGMVEYEKV